MPMLIKTAGWIGSLLAILALVITLLKQVIGFIGFMTVIIKVGVVVLFAALFLGIALLAYKAWSSNRKVAD